MEPDTPDTTLSAIPSRLSRALAFVAICIGGLSGGLIGYAVVDLQCSGDCSLPLGLGILAGAILCAGGTAIVSVLVLRAQGEWRELHDSPKKRFG
ncbi:MAG: hypothetical protein EXQ63_04145 [Ilumatobacteraceae bacterium]|nr:hypothetical protein [Ilumatobacteraceae bacterium]